MRRVHGYSPGALCRHQTIIYHRILCSLRLDGLAEATRLANKFKGRLTAALEE
jgi:hypothetical protein